jgi:predicted DNA-binding protein with PD1-like motif
LGQLPQEGDLLESIEGFCRKNGITLGVFNALGTVKSARLAYYDQESREYREFAIDEPMEMVSCIGNISLRDGEPIVHAHLALSDGAGRTISGHLMPGTPIFICQIFIQELVG